MEEDGGGGLGFMELLTSGASILLFDGSASSSMLCFSGKQEEEEEENENSKCSNVSENSKKIAVKKPKTECPASAASFHGSAKRRKEKLGDRITALQQLVSPFGKSDTATVLHEALGYIRFLHDQVQVLSSPYLRNLHMVRPLALQAEEEARRIDDLRSRGLCLVPVSCAEQVTSSNGADFWSPSMTSMTRGSKSSSSISKH
ncbi:transcription factor bHLH113-like [Curcuma longa]|uniref:transcription factor bHLH113-like n=1 Tax=Curcuma longa TaxID=136217 RepID=UPI003D9E980C